MKPLSARSLIASALLGSHPPRLPGHLLVALAERFGIAGGTARVALSRMVDRGELVNDDGTYALAGDLLERQARQDARRHDSSDPWDGRWEQALIVSTGRSAADRSGLRRHLTSLGLGERREGVWMRPANLEPSRLPAARAATSNQVDWFTIDALDPGRSRALATVLFDLEGWAATAETLIDALADAQRRLEHEPDAVVEGFLLAAEALRHQTHDPQLPAELEPDAWPAARLRRTYASYEAAYQALLRAFFRSQRAPA